MAKQAPDTDKGRDTVRDQTRFQHISTQKTQIKIDKSRQPYNPCNVFEMIVCWFSYCFDMTTKTKVCL